MKVKEVLDYIREGEEVKLIISDISTIEIDDYCICIRSRIPDGYHLTLERQECEVSCCHD